MASKAIIKINEKISFFLDKLVKAIKKIEIKLMKENIPVSEKT
ncbi:MAG: hypothetical protein ACD_79C00973G0004 [uncultured bacterium]|nr:MAG: hypothetical protein ACD_79C00973G0004 [uncultured bacterium]